MSIFFFVVVIPLGIFVITSVFSVVAVYREKQVVWHLAPMNQPGLANQSSVITTQSGAATANQYAASRTGNSAYQPPSEVSQQQTELPVTPYAMRQGTSLEAMGFQFLRTMRHSKGGLYKIRYDVLLSADRLTLALIEAGNMSVFRVENVTFVSLGMTPGMPDQRCALESITSESCYNDDSLGRIKTMLFPNASMEKLVGWHQRRLQSFQAIAYSANPLEDFRIFSQECFAARHEHGELRYVDASEQVALPTLWGGIKQVVKMYCFMIGRRIYPHRWRIGKVAHS